MLYVVNADPKKNVMTETEFLPLPDDLEEPAMSKEEIQQRKAAFERMMKNKTPRQNQIKPNAKLSRT